MSCSLTSISKFELRLKSDLAIWTRACVNITLANFTLVQIHRDKNKFAEEALRLVQELKADRTLGDNAVERASYDKLETIATELVRVTNEEVRAFRECWQEDEQKRRQEGDGDEMVGDEGDENEGQGVEIDEPAIKRDRRTSIQPWSVEGAFSTVPYTEKVNDTSDSHDEEMQDELTELPTLPVRGGSKNRGRAQLDPKSGLATPAASSDVEAD